MTLKRLDGTNKMIVVSDTSCISNKPFAAAYTVISKNYYPVNVFKELNDFH